MIKKSNHLLDLAFKVRAQTNIHQLWCKSCKYFDFKEVVEYIIRNCYVTIGYQVVQQITGIPQGSDPAPIFAYLFLFFFEWQYMNDLKKENVILLRKFCQPFRFIDDVITISNEHFEKNILNIYAAELELKTEK